jgi:hypothetical protein
MTGLFHTLGAQSIRLEPPSTGCSVDDSEQVYVVSAGAA